MKSVVEVHLWRRLASPKWWSENEERLCAIAGNDLAIIERPNRKCLQLEIPSNNRRELRDIAKQFGGRIEKLPRNWLKRALGRKTKPIQVGTKKLTIPAAAAFGTGEHATTAMSLGLLDKLTRTWNRGWSIFDLGTGSGILALAANLLGAGRVVAIDNDPMAISTATQNARLNKIRGVKFQVADVRRWRMPGNVDVMTANLFSELLVEVIPKLTRAHWLILSGILRVQERDVRRALTRNAFDIIDVRRRGKWVAMLARHR